MGEVIRDIPGTKIREIVCLCGRKPKTIEKASRGVVSPTFVFSRLVLIQELILATEEGCENCSLILDAIVTWWTGQNLSPSCRFQFRFSSQHGLRIHYMEEIGDVTEIQVVHLTDYPQKVKTTSRDIFWRMKQVRPLSANTSSDVTLRLLKDWIRNCEENHTSCKRQRASPLPKRILEIAAGSVYLREQLDFQSNYACLSHCWGSDGPAVRLTKASMASLSQGHAISELPKTFRDAVIVCHSLEISYIWIDALCIIQDSSEDWEEAANTMADIYENAYITIAAVSSPNSHKGLFSPDRIAMCLSKHPQYHVRPFPPSFPYDGGLDRSEKHLWPLLRRAWVHQERTLSPRTVYFSDYQVYWECGYNVASEDGDTLITWKDFHCSKRQHWREDPITSWQATVRRYSELQLTYEKDRLPAIAAIADRMSRLRKADEVYIAGMWKNSILSDLWWFCQRNYLAPRPERTVPSWSWASIRGAQISFASPVLREMQKIVSLDHEIVGGTYLGNVKNARLLLRGHVLSTNGAVGLLHHDGSEPHQRSPVLESLMSDAMETILQKHGLHVHLSCFLPDYDLTTLHPPLGPETGMKILLVEQREIGFMGLVLRQLTRTLDQYERIGWISADFYHSESATGMTRSGFTTAIPTIKPFNGKIDQIVQSLPVEDIEIV